jgi:acyl dehydratase
LPNAAATSTGAEVVPWGSVAGDSNAEEGRLPSLVIPVTRSLIIAGAIASRDYQDIHHDPESARRRGAKDIFMNILTTNGLVSRFVTDWAGPNVSLRRIAIRLGAQNYPGDTMVLTGRVIDEGRTGEEIEISISGVNSLGNHVTGTVSLVVPQLGEGSR